MICEWARHLGPHLWWGEAPERLMRLSKGRRVDQSITRNAKQSAEPVSVSHYREGRVVAKMFYGFGKPRTEMSTGTNGSARVSALCTVSPINQGRC